MAYDIPQPQEKALLYIKVIYYFLITNCTAANLSRATRTFSISKIGILCRQKGLMMGFVTLSCRYHTLRELTESEIRQRMHPALIDAPIVFVSYLSERPISHDHPTIAETRSLYIQSLCSFSPITPRLPTSQATMSQRRGCIDNKRQHSLYKMQQSSNTTGLEAQRLCELQF